jgi:hypothetical protein
VKPDNFLPAPTTRPESSDALRADEGRNSVCRMHDLPVTHPIGENEQDDARSWRFAFEMIVSFGKCFSVLILP